MKNNEHSSGYSSGDGWILSLIHKVLSYYSGLISKPFESGLAYFVSGLVFMLIIGWLIFPMVLYSKQEQPLNFNHALHMNPDIVNKIKGSNITMGDTDAEKCHYCHSFRDDGSFTGIPKIDVCEKCHVASESPLGETPDEELFMNEYVRKGKEVPWLSYSRQPDCVYFTHIAHIKIGELECRVCHGDHDKTMTLPAYKKNRISSYSINIWGKNIAGIKTNSWDRMKMDDCAACHTEKGHEENNACFVCHK
ncbi:MAG: cytochrome c3 family protein [Desulfobacteraceae bacterium]|jgi:hypothetical protein